VTGPVLAAILAAVTILSLRAATSPGSHLLLGTAPDRAVEGSSRGRRVATLELSLVVVPVAVSVVGWIVAGVPGLVGGAAAGVAIPVGIDRRRRARVATRTEEQLIDAVSSVAASLRTGRSLVQSLGAAGDEIGRPLGPVLAEATDRVALGIELDRVLDDVAARIGGADARLVIGVLRLHRRTGGALATALDDLAHTLRARREGARELRSLTAQARLSALILGLLPLGFFLFLSIVARDDVEAAYRSTAGAAAIGIGLALQGAAFVWIRRLLRVEGV
jgi:tight adherence protein B